MFSRVTQSARRALKQMVRRFAPWELEAGLAFWKSAKDPIFAQRNLFVTDEVAPEKVLVLAPHPDDEAIGPGGLVARLLEVQSSITVVYLTDGGGCVEPRQPMIDIRRQEAERLCAASGLQPQFWNLPDTQLSANEATVARMVQLFEDFQPTMVCLPAPTDHHRDHFATCQIAAAAFARRPEFNPQVVCYEVWDQLPWPNYVLNISRHFDAKQRLIEFHATPCRTTDFVQFARERAALRFKLHITSERHAAEHGYAEAFWRIDASDFVRLMNTATFDWQ